MQSPHRSSSIGPERKKPFLNTDSLRRRRREGDRSKNNLREGLPPPVTSSRLPPLPGKDPHVIPPLLPLFFGDQPSLRTLRRQGTENKVGIRQGSQPKRTLVPRVTS